MRILVVAGHAPSLVNFRGPLLAALAARGHHVLAAAPPEPGDGEATRATLRRLGVAELLPYPLDRGGTNPVRDARTILALRRMIIDRAPNLVLPYTIKPVIYASLAARWAGSPRVVSLVTGLGYAFGGLDADGGMDMPGRLRTVPRRCLAGFVVRLYEKALERNDAVIFQNPDDRALFERLGILGHGQRVAVVGGSGVDLTHFSPVPPARTETGAPVFLCVARLLWAKGVGVYVEACRMLKRRHPEVVCRLLGQPDAVPDAVPAEVLRRWREDRVVEIVDSVDDVREQLAAASVFVLPSFREGAPRATLEAMAMARPVVTTDMPGCRQTVEDGVTGYLVPPFEPGELSRAMERFVLDPESIATMGQAARRLAEERFDVERVTRDMLAVLPLPENAPSAASPIPAPPDASRP